MLCLLPPYTAIHDIFPVQVFYTTSVQVFFGLPLGLAFFSILEKNRDFRFRIRTSSIATYKPGLISIQHTTLMYNLRLTINDISLSVSNGINCLNLFHSIQILASTAASANPSIVPTSDN